ncbi:sigma-54-dependent Fis family transcriptional regulator, partial [Escherichia coli]|uniref:sigma-54-dependent transcriptional regulator n=1 Tax=Escherichia coli TaxID=562 RepID=UPI0015E5BD39
EQTLTLAGYRVISCCDAEHSIPLIQSQANIIILTDVRLPGISGLELLSYINEMDSKIPVILITGHGDVEMAVDAMRNGAFDFIEKPSIARAVEKRRLVLENQQLLANLQQENGPVLIGRSPQMQQLRKMILNVADTGADVLIYGETGCGKEVVARMLHHWSTRRQGQFVALNCAGLPETLFESEIFGHEAGAFTGAVKKRIGKIE